VDLIVATSGAFCESAERWLGETEDVRCYVVGPLQNAAFTHSTRGVTVTGLRLRPGHGERLLGTSAHELTRAPVTLRDLWRGVTSHEIEQIANTPRWGDRLRLLEQVVLRRVASRPSIDPMVSKALQFVEATQGRISVDGLLARLDVGARHLERKFRQHVGLAPKKLCQIAQIRHALELVRRQSGPNWSRIAVDCGFYDQAHFIRHFKAVTGITPKAYLAEVTLKLSER
jgi:AraC-like DNA-binding protein